MDLRRETGGGVAIGEAFALSEADRVALLGLDLRALAFRMQCRVDAIRERDGVDGAVTGPGIGIGYLFARDIAGTLNRGADFVDAQGASNDELAASRPAHAETTASVQRFKQLLVDEQAAHAATESRRAIQHANAVRLRQERAKMLAALEKARQFVSEQRTRMNVGTIGLERFNQTVGLEDELVALLASLRDPPAAERAPGDAP